MRRAGTKIDNQEKGYGNQLVIDSEAEIIGDKTVRQLVSILAQFKIHDKFGSIKLDLRKKAKQIPIRNNTHALKNGHRYHKGKQSMHIQYERGKGQSILGYGILATSQSIDTRAKVFPNPSIIRLPYRQSMNIRLQYPHQSINNNRSQYPQSINIRLQYPREQVNSGRLFPVVVHVEVGGRGGEGRRDGGRSLGR